MRKVLLKGLVTAAALTLSSGSAKAQDAPVAATHSNARGLIDNTRNLSDAELDAIKANGGIVQLTPFSSYLHLATEAERAKVSAVRVRFGLPAAYEIVYDGSETLAAARREAYLDAASDVAPRATLSEYADHIDYVAKRIGWRHVGIGTDFDHGAGVTGFDSEAEAPNVTDELLKRGYTPDQVVAIWGAISFAYGAPQRLPGPNRLSSRTAREAGAV